MFHPFPSFLFSPFQFALIVFIVYGLELRFWQFQDAAQRLSFFPFGLFGRFEKRTITTPPMGKRHTYPVKIRCARSRSLQCFLPSLQNVFSSAFRSRNMDKHTFSDLPQSLKPATYFHSMNTA
jgi:hypothetical protein